MNQEKNITKVLVFDVWSDYAHFRRGYTTTSPLTFSIPPRTVLCGLIGAILGLEKEDNKYLKHLTLDKAKIGLRLLNPVKKVKISENLIDTKTARGIGMNLIKNRTRIGFEFLKDPRYRIYFWHSNKELYSQLKESLSKHKTKYTPCLGLSENIANFEFLGELSASIKRADNKILFHSVISSEKLSEKQGINFDLRGEYFSVRIPVEMNQERIITKYSDILFERNGKPIESKLSEAYCEINYYNGTKENIVFIE